MIIIYFAIALIIVALVIFLFVNRNCKRRPCRVGESCCVGLRCRTVAFPNLLVITDAPIFWDAGGEDVFSVQTDGERGARGMVVQLKPTEFDQFSYTKDIQASVINPGIGYHEGTDVFVDLPYKHLVDGIEFKGIRLFLKVTNVDSYPYDVVNSTDDVIAPTATNMGFCLPPKKKMRTG